MHSFVDLSSRFEHHFANGFFPKSPDSLYAPCEYFLKLGGKRIRPVLCLMGNELFDEIHPDAFHLAAAIELFHNFSLIHDDIMDKAPLRRGKPTLHSLHGESTALLAGDVMLVVAYEQINKIESTYTKEILRLFNKTAKEVCEGQQMDMDFEKMDGLTLNEYLHMIELKTSVLLAASLQMGAILGGGGEGNQLHLYEFGRNLGIAFQIQDDYLDAFGDPKKFGKQVGGDIMSNKKTFLLIHALESASLNQQNELRRLLSENSEDKVEKVLEIFRSSGIDKWAMELKEQYMKKAFIHLDDIAVTQVRKKPLLELAHYLMERDK